MKKEIILEGLPLSEGIALGKPYVLQKEQPRSPLKEKTINVEQEVSRFRQALGLSRVDLCSLQSSLSNEGSAEIVEILDTHLAMLQDPFIEKVEEDIRNNPHDTAEAVFLQAISDYKKKFSRKKNPFFEERIGDVIDVAGRILGHLRPFSKVNIGDIPPGSIFIVQEFSPSMIAEINPQNICGLIAEKGGLSSHSTIIARAKSIPYVASIHRDCWGDVDELIIDGDKGIVILNPKSSTKDDYRQLLTDRDTLSKYWEKTLHIQDRKKESACIEVWANVDHGDQMASSAFQHASGVGLYRSELLALGSAAFPSEQEQFLVYSSLVKKARAKPVIIRLFDIGEDKTIPDRKGAGYTNSLGRRGMRFLLEHSSIFEAQVRALLRASRFGDLRVLLPMIADVAEFLDIQQKIVAIGKQVQKKEGRALQKILVGAMIELPAAAFLVERIAEAADFLSIGSNDLVQYTLAADRQDADLATIYSAYHPSVLRLLSDIAKAGKKQKKPVLLCGEFGSDERAIPLILGLGIRSLSVPLGKLPKIKCLLRQGCLEKAKALAQEALKKNSTCEVQALIAD